LPAGRQGSALSWLWFFGFLVFWFFGFLFYVLSPKSVSLADRPEARRPAGRDPLFLALGPFAPNLDKSNIETRRPPDYASQERMPNRNARPSKSRETLL
jgi:hypothetical protein